MTAKHFKNSKGLSLIEVMVSLLILSVAVIGAGGYRYYAALDARKAATEITAARMAMLLCESWRGINGAESYDPIAHLSSDLPITKSTMFEFNVNSAITGPAVGKGFTLLGVYEIVSGEVNYYAVLSWKNIAAGLRALNVVVAWPVGGQRTTSTNDYSHNIDAYKSFELTIYVTN